MPKPPVRRKRKAVVVPPDVLGTAVRLIEMGLPLVACNGKKPIGKDWPNNPLAVEDTASLNGGRNVGLILNHTELIDVECDSEEAAKAIRPLFGGKIPKTVAWRSERGTHRLFRRPKGCPEKSVVRVDDVEFRLGNNGKGAQSILPPCDGREWLPGCSLFDREPAELPDCVVERLNEATTKKAPTQAKTGPIPEGERNDTLFRMSCEAMRSGLSESSCLAAMKSTNSERCRPPLDDAEVTQIVASAAKTLSDASSFDALMGSLDLWSDQNDDPYATVPQGEHFENWLIDKRSKPFRRWVSAKHYELNGFVMNSLALGDLLESLAGRALYGGPKEDTWRRMASADGRLYVDLCDEKWRAVEIDRDGWRIVDRPPVRFVRARAMGSLGEPRPTEKGLRELLEPFLNLREGQWPLVLAWLVAAMRPDFPVPLLSLMGEQGSSKTTTARVLRELVDPNAVPVRSESKSTQDLMIAANNSWVLCFDNLSHVDPKMSDALCRLVTGGGFSTRTLYTTSDETVLEAKRPIVTTSIESVVDKSDLLERSLIIELPAIPPEKRLVERVFWERFAKARPEIIGALLNAVSGALRALPDVEKKSDEREWPRMIDFAMFATAAEPTLGLDDGQVLEAFDANRAEANLLAIDANPALTALLEWSRKEPAIEGTAGELLGKLGGHAPPGATTKPRWPKLPNQLSAVIARAAPILRQLGITATKHSSGRGSERRNVWRIENPSPEAAERFARRDRRLEAFRRGRAK